MAISWDDQRVLHALLEERSLSGAARRLGLSHPTVRGRLDGLEAQIGAPLFTRSGAGLNPTDRGLALEQAVQDMARAADLFNRQASAQPDSNAGRVRVSVPDMIGVWIAPMILASLARKYPGIQVELVLSNRNADLLEREVDVAIRAIGPTQKALVAQKVGQVGLGLFAAKSYLKSHPEPQSWDDISEHRLMTPDRNLEDFELGRSLGIDFSKHKLVLRCDNHPAQYAAIRAGLGLGVAQLPLGQSDPCLTHVLPNEVVATLPFYVVAQEQMLKIPRVRTVFDVLVGEMKAYVEGTLCVFPDG